MRPRTTRTAAALAAILAAGLAATRLEPDGRHHATLAAHTRSRDPDRRPSGAPFTSSVTCPVLPGLEVRSEGARGACLRSDAAVSTHASGSHKQRYDGCRPGGDDARPAGHMARQLALGLWRRRRVTTRTSGSHGAGSANGAPAGSPVATRTSGSARRCCARRSGNPVTTRTQRRRRRRWRRLATPAAMATAGDTSHARGGRGRTRSAHRWRLLTLAAFLAVLALLAWQLDDAPRRRPSPA